MHDTPIHLRNHIRKRSNSQTSEFFQNTLTFGSFLKRPRIIAGMIAGFSSIMTQVYFTPYLSKYLKYRYRIQEQYHGLYYALRAFSSALVAMASPCLSKKLGRSNSIWFFYLVILIAHIFFAQSWALGLPQNIYFIVIGLFLMGLSQSQMYVPVVPDLTQYMIEDYKQKQRRRKGIPNNQQIEMPAQYVQRSVQIISSLFVFSFGVSQVVGPMMGAALYEQIGYRKAGDAENLLLIIFFVYYSIFGGVTWLRCKTKSIDSQQNIKNLLNQ